MFNLDKLDTTDAMPSIVFMREKEEIRLRGELIGYTSKMLRKAVMNSFNHKHKVEDQVRKLIRKKVIIPFMYFKEDNSYMTWKLLPVDKYNKAVWGWYTGSVDNKIYLSINSLGHVNGNIDKERIFNLAVHELMHMAAFNFYREFFTVFSMHFVKFYKNFIRNYFKKDLDEQNILQWVKMLITNEVKNDASNFAEKYITYLESMNGYFLKNNLNSDKRNFLMTTLMRPSKIFNTLKKNDKYDLQKSLLDSYQTSFDVTPPNFVYQELLYPSEVISVYSQFHKDEFVEKILGYVIKRFYYKQYI